MNYKTEQERFWAGEFGYDYMGREPNANWQLLASNVALFSRVLQRAPGVRSACELGCNIGMNLQALHQVKRDLVLAGVEINEHAAAKARDLKVATITQGTIIEPLQLSVHDLTFTKGVLIHIHPDYLSGVYENLHRLSSRYILVAEYYNPTPVTVNYRGNADRLFKRDFAGELMDRFGLRLLDYGFIYRRDNYFADDDINWFLLEK